MDFSFERQTMRFSEILIETFEIRHPIYLLILCRVCVRRFENTEEKEEKLCSGQYNVVIEPSKYMYLKAQPTEESGL